jgi:hypothetical protein
MILNIIWVRIERYKQQNLRNAAMKDIAMQIQIAVGVPAISDIAPSTKTKGLTAAPRFITVMLTP